MRSVILTFSLFCLFFGLPKAQAERVCLSKDCRKISIQSQILNLSKNRNKGNDSKRNVVLLGCRTCEVLKLNQDQPQEEIASDKKKNTEIEIKEHSLVKIPLDNRENNEILILRPAEMDKNELLYPVQNRINPQYAPMEFEILRFSVF